MRLNFCVALILLAAATVSAQQIETNSTGGSLTRSGVNPTPGCPFTVGANGTIDFRINGNPVSPYILALGTLAPTSTQFGALNGQYFDLDIPTTFVLGDGISGGGALPAFLCATNGTGVSNWSFPSNPGLIGGSFALQAIVVDPALPPVNLNITAAINFSFPISVVVGTPPGAQVGANLTGDDAAVLFTTSHAYPIYGVGRTQFAVSTNGFIRMAANTTTEPSETSAEMLAGTPGALTAAPMIALLWEDLDMGNQPNQSVQCFEDTTTNTLTFIWNNGEYYTSTIPNWGTIFCQITDLGGTCQITLDYTGYSFTAGPTPPSEGIIGVSDGNTALTPGVNTQADLVTGCTVNPYVATGDFETYFQNFDGSGGVGTPAAQAIDISGLVITFIDQSPVGNGNWFVF